MYNSTIPVVISEISEKIRVRRVKKIRVNGEVNTQKNVNNANNELVSSEEVSILYDRVTQRVQMSFQPELQNVFPW